MRKEGRRMNETFELKRRDLYLNKLIAFQDTKLVKVVTGIRRCGKSSLLKLMARHLKESGVPANRIIEMNFESRQFYDMTAAEFYDYVARRIVPGGRTYLFFDEVQRVEKWENAVNSFRVDFDCDIYLTGSNAYLLSSEYSTYLAGRYVEIKMLPLSFKEFLYFHGFKTEKGAANVAARRVTDEKGKEYDLRHLFNAYVRFGGMPGIAEVGLEQEKALALLDGIYSTVVIRDILERESRRGGRKLTDSVLLRKIIYFLADNIGSNVSVSSIGRVLANEGLLAEKKTTPSAHTAQAYVDALREAYFFYEIKRFDIKGKEYLRTLGKYYIVDIGLRNYLLGYRDRDSGYVLENIVYFELLRRGYDVAIGKIGAAEVDFIAAKADEKIYAQVTESTANREVRERELAPLRKIADNYEKIVLSLDTGLIRSIDGIKLRNVIDWLLEE